MVQTSQFDRKFLFFSFFFRYASNALKYPIRGRTRTTATTKTREIQAKIRKNGFTDQNNLRYVDISFFICFFSTLFSCYLKLLWENLNILNKYINPITVDGCLYKNHYTFYWNI